MLGAVYIPGSLPAQGSRDPTGAELIERARTPFFGDLDEILERGFLRVLVSPTRTNYYVERGKPRGFEYELLRQYEAELRKRTSDRLTMVFLPVPFDELIPRLEEGLGDIAAAGLTITPERAERVAFTEPYLRDVREIVVTHEGAPRPGSLEELAGRDVYVVRDSSHARHLAEINLDLWEEDLPKVEIEEAPASLESEDLLEMVHSGIIELTVADEHVAEIWHEALPNLVPLPDLAVHTGGRLAFAVRQTEPKLRADLDRFVLQHRKGTRLGNIWFNRYFQQAQGLVKPSDREIEELAELRPLFEKYGERYGFDWLVLASLAFQESRFDQSARSRSGAVGVMQIKPSTAADRNVGIGNVEKVENNVHAGTKYLAFLRDTYFSDPQIERPERVDFTLAAYNAGPGRLRELRARAPSLGYDPNQWFDNVEEVALQIVGWQPVRYVANINKYYLAFKLALEIQQEREQARKRVRSVQR